MLLEEITYKINRATHQDIVAHLTECSALFIPPLEYRTNINTYASKIESLADTIEAWVKGDLVGLIAVYCNDLDSRQAYITSVSIKRQFGGMGIASELLKRCIQHVKEANFFGVNLEVHEKNEKAITLYKRHGFEAIGTNHRIVIMRYDIND